MPWTLPYCVPRCPACFACIIMLNPHSNPMRLCCYQHHHHHPCVMAEKLRHSPKWEKSGVFLVSLVKYLLREEIEALWNFLSVVGFNPLRCYALPSRSCPHLRSHVQRKGGLEILTLWHIPLSKGLDTYLICPLFLFNLTCPTVSLSLCSWSLMTQL